jgi:outer membrane protein TolC
VFETQLLVEAELNLRAALAGYQSGKVDFDTVIEAERQVREARLRALGAAVTQQRALAQFEQVTGVQP